MDFRAGLILPGRTTFERAVADPDALAGLPVVIMMAGGEVAGSGVRASTRWDSASSDGAPVTSFRDEAGEAVRSTDVPRSSQEHVINGELRRILRFRIRAFTGAYQVELDITPHPSVLCGRDCLRINTLMAKGCRDAFDAFY